MKTNIYVDGFNLYHRCVKGTPHKWLNIWHLCELMFPHYSIQRLRYFTADVQPKAGDPGIVERQQMYLRALKTLPGCTIHKGQFRRREHTGEALWPREVAGKLACVATWEEKRSDVNLATYLLLDAFDHDCKAAIIISNDSDLTEPIKAVRDRFAIKTIVVNPELPAKRRQSGNKKHPQVSALLGAADEFRHLRVGPLQASQFPEEMEDTAGIIRKPAQW
ncbi:MAG: NYN domain-containing protein [Dehalococcoidales bacterium]|nr:NYN domain-containing protein [Dehalococcoidales bacterium]